MPSTNRTTKIKAFQKFLQKRYKHAPQTQSRKVLEHLVYAACLENATFEQADDAFSVLEHHYIDWNEIRVSTANELAYTFPHHPGAVIAGERIRKSLQAVFEVTYMFDLEDLRKKNLSQAVDFLGSLGVCSRFMIDYTTHNALGGHVIPLDESALRVFRILGLAQTNKDNTREVVGGLERAITKQEGQEFANLLHHFAVEFYPAADPGELQQLLKSIDSQTVKRNWTAPVLAVAKQAKPEKRKPVIPPIVAAAVIDDDLDTIEVVSDVEELEFIPNPITGEETPLEPGDDEEEREETSAKSTQKAAGKAAKKETASPKKTAVKKEAAPKPETKKVEVKKASVKKPEKPIPVPPKIKEEKEKSPKPPQPSKQTPKKQAENPSPAKAKPDAKAKAVKKEEKQGTKKTPASPKSQTSPLKKLRQNKPK